MKFLSKKNKEMLSNPNYEIVVKSNPTSPAAEAYRRIKVAIDFANVDNVLKVIQIVSSVKGEGKTTTLLNIAESYAEQKVKVIVVDLDLRKPKVHRAFKIENTHGLSDVILGNIELKDAIKHSDEFSFDILNTGYVNRNLYSILSSEQMKNILETLKSMYDIVLIDCPPILSVSDGIIISHLCDGTLFCVSQSISERKVSKDAIKLLRENNPNVNILGVIYNGVKVNKHSKAYNYYYNSYEENNNK